MVARTDLCLLGWLFKHKSEHELVCGDDLPVHWHLGKGALRTRGVLYPVHDVALRA